MKRLIADPPDKRKIESVVSSVTSSGVKAGIANLTGEDEAVLSRQHNPQDPYKHPAFAYLRDMWARSSCAPESFKAIRSLVDRHLDEYEDPIEKSDYEKSMDEWAVSLNCLFETFINSYMRRRPEHEIAAAAEIFGVKFTAFQKWIGNEPANGHRSFKETEHKG